MEFTLVYDGRLKANGNPKSKQQIRRILHAQFKQLWEQEPLRSLAPPEGHFLDDDPPETSLSIIHRVSGFRFSPLISAKLHLVAELNMTMLRPEAPGSIVGQGGDIDNRLKTLLDALRMPRDESELPKNDSPLDGEDPFFCLLEDDHLVTKISVATDRLLTPCDDPTLVRLLIHVKSKATLLTYANIGLG